MSFSFILDWKTVSAFGISVVAIIFASKMDASAAERVSVHAIDAFAERAVAGNGDR